ncbi:leucyl aminopeptidase [Roseateles sp. P5_E11]
MIFSTASAPLGALAAHKTDALILVIAGEAVADSLDGKLRSLISDGVRMGDFEFQAGKTLLLIATAGVQTRRLLIAASGTASSKAARRALSAALAQLKGSGATAMSVMYLGFGDEVAEQLAEQTVLATLEATYVYSATKPSASAAYKLARLTLLTEKGNAPSARAAKGGLLRGEAIGAGVSLARECANLPANVATPAYLADQAKSLARKHGLKVEVLDEQGIERLGMGSFLAVAKGSDTPPRFIVAKYEGAPKSQAPLVLIGKGITFDSGGISLKPGAGMEEMKFDMGGAAAVLGTLRAVVELKPRINLVVLIAACENMPSGRAVKPGDVVTSMSGQTIEILNTDAEGRLILCDALTYAERFKPAAVVDVATLTGSCVVALGALRSGMYATNDELAAALSAAGEVAMDPCWRMPLDDEYGEDLKSTFADVGNIGGKAGSVTAAKFLQRFVGNYPWGHLDIAGTAWQSGGRAKGATGRPVGLLTHFVLSQAR